MYILQIGQAVGRDSFKVKHEERSTDREYLFKKYQEIQLNCIEAAVLINTETRGVLKKGAYVDICNISTII